LIYPERSLAFAFHDWKGAALYFDDVLCPSAPDDEILCDRNLETEVIEAINTNYPTLRWMHRVSLETCYEEGHWPPPGKVEPIIHPKLHPHYFQAIVRQAALWATEFQGGRLAVSLWGMPLSAVPAPEASDTALVLANLQLVDVSRVGWRQILELRKDEDATRQLRNLRRTVYKD